MNNLTKDGTRLPFPELTRRERFAIINLCRHTPDTELVWKDRRYWADKNLGVYVVAWDDGHTISGDPIDYL